MADKVAISVQASQDQQNNSVKHCLHYMFTLSGGITMFYFWVEEVSKVKL